MHNYYFKIEVTGSGQFPFDQLRRYEMFPLDVDTVRKFEFISNSRKTYTLGMYASSLSADVPCLDRFRSFGFVGETQEIWKNDELFMKLGEPVGQDMEYVAS